jgi:hypothetical protein
MPPPNYPALWQCIGMMVGVFGVGYAIAATDPVRYWPLVLVGLLGKICGPIGFVIAALAGEFPWVAGWTILTNDVAWWLPFVLILRHAHRVSAEAGAAPDFAEAITTARDQNGVSLEAISRQAPLLVVFLRHLG